jgi:hypothetical protein
VTRSLNVNFAAFVGAVMRTMIKIFISASLMVVSISAQVEAQSQHVNNWPILMPWVQARIKTIPIHSYYDSLFVMGASFDGGGVCSKIGDPPIYYRFGSSSITQGMEFIVSPQGGFYVYSGSNLMFNFSYSTHDERYCPGRPVFDINDRIHILEELSPGNYVYIISDDTLNSLVYVDTLSSLPQMHKLVASPDHSTIGATFFAPKQSDFKVYKR